jgi:uncharacterized protein YegL
LQSDQPLVLLTAAIELLADQQDDKALPKVLELLADSRWPVRSTVYGFLRRVRALESIPALIAAAEQETGRLHHEAMEALRGLTGLTYQQTEHWARWWETEGKKFKLPALAKQTGDATAEPSRAAVTYYSLPVVSQRVCFVIDVSGSMASLTGTGVKKITEAQQALLAVIKHIDPQTHINLIAFDGTAKAWHKALQQANDDSRAKAKNYVENLRASGGTNVHDAMEQAFADPDVDTIFLLSDGSPSSGPITDVQELADTIQHWNRSRKVIIHTIAIGNDSPFLERLAKESGGLYKRRI